MPRGEMWEEGGANSCSKMWGNKIYGPKCVGRIVVGIYVTEDEMLEKKCAGWNFRKNILVQDTHVLVRERISYKSLRKLWPLSFRMIRF